MDHQAARPYTKHTSANLRLVGIACILTVILLTPSRLLAQGGETEIPLWQQGISTWNGTSYDLPKPAPTATSNPVVAKPYTMPVEPGAARSSQFVLPVAATDVPLTDHNVNLSAPQTGGVPVPQPVEELPPPVKTSGEGDATKTIGQAIVAGETAEQPPLQQEVIRWYHYPQRWMKGWDSHAEFGIDGSDGNAVTLAIQTGLEMKRKTDRYTLAVDIDYRQASNRNVVVEDNGRFNLDYDRLLGDSRWAGFGKFGLEWDKFKVFDLRVNLNGGVGYHWIRDDDATLVTRFGAGASQEIGAPDDDWVAEAVFGIEAERQLTARQKLKGKVDYFPAWENFNNYRLVTDLAWEILLDGSENLSLKLAVTDRYDSTPQGAKANDIYYSLLLLYKF